MKKILALLMVVLVLTSCTATPTPDPNQGAEEYSVKDYFPFLENTHLVYQGIGNEYAEKEVFFEFIQDQYYQMKVSNPGTTLAQVYEVTDTELRLIASYEEIYFSHNFINEVVEKKQQDNNNHEEVLLMKPFQEGTKWSLSDGREREITGVNITIETPHKSYEAIEVTTTNDEGSKSINYFAVGVGLVKTVFDSGEFEIVTTLEEVVTNTPLEQHVRIYYPDFLKEKIVYTEEQIQLQSNDQIERKLEEFLKEPPADEINVVMGENAVINEIIFNREEWMVSVDFNRAFITEMVAGAFLESQILTSVGNTFGDYFNVEKVVITIDGLPYESGHILIEEGEFITPRLDEAVPYNQE
ncbi:GerMN domain-containing protein [Alkaliphilus transvaalensis]|uniref:GerMN domain-containing protein n=1 Tax=Alkaliphilus transvaalensis TaxID=114628 RepID=UPI00068866E7|nr:GerMN domain-containing protein [Alkaliphilus transvaalensis]